MDKLIITIFAVVFALLFRFAFLGAELTIDDVIADIDAPELLKIRIEEFDGREMVKVADGVHVAINYAWGNAILIEGPTGKIIVDTTESLEAAREIAVDFNKITQKETKAIIYTHHHADHIMGGQAFISESNPDVEVWAHRLFDKEEKRIMLKGVAYAHRAMAQFGLYFDGARNIADIGRFLRLKQGQSFVVEPTHIVDDDLDIQVAGMTLRLIHIPGESSDQIGVWIPESRVLLCADDMYKAFPNLYAIRGVTPRDVMDWAESLDKMRQLRAVCIVGSHGHPVCGEQEVYDLLSSYMFAIQYVHDQTVRYINKGIHPDEIAKLVKLPDSLANHPYLIEYYGTVHWSVKAVYIMYLGWFSGQAVDLDPLPPVDRAERIIKLIGKNKLLRSAEKALSEGDHQWALELATHVHRLEPDNVIAKRVRRESIAKLAENQISALGRNYYMTEMIQDENLIPKRDIHRFIKLLPMKSLFQAMRTSLNGDELPPGEDIKGCFQFTDTDLFVSAWIHYGILEVDFIEPEECTFKVVTTETVWKSLMAEERSNIGAYFTGDVKVEGSVQTVRRFLGYFERS